MITASERRIVTVRGVFIQDLSGLWHYVNQTIGTVYTAAEDAIQHKPNAATWFWFNGTPAPINLEDNASELTKRWDVWRDAYQTNDQGHSLLAVMTSLTET